MIDKEQILKIKKDYLKKAIDEQKEQNLIDIFSFIKSIEGKGTQTSPEQYAKTIISIMKFGGLPEKEIKRQFSYFKTEFDKL